MNDDDIKNEISRGTTQKFIQVECPSCKSNIIKAAPRMFGRGNKRGSFASQNFKCQSCGHSWTVQSNNK